MTTTIARPPEANESLFAPPDNITDNTSPDDIAVDIPDDIADVLDEHLDEEPIGEPIEEEHRSNELRSSVAVDYKSCLLYTSPSPRD